MKLTASFIIGAVTAIRPSGLREWHCPYLPGELKSKVTALDVQRLKGVWINLWGEKQDQHTCMGTKFENIDGNGANSLSLSTSNSVTNIHVHNLIADQHPHMAQDYHIHEGRQLTFDNSSDSTLARIEYSKVHKVDKNHHVENDTFDPHLFDSQYLRYAQVLDTDYDNYILLYSCQEINEYFEAKTHQDIPLDKVWKLAEKNVTD